MIDGNFLLGPVLEPEKRSMETSSLVRSWSQRKDRLRLPPWSGPGVREKIDWDFLLGPVLESKRSIETSSLVWSWSLKDRLRLPPWSGPGVRKDRLRLPPWSGLGVREKIDWDFLLGPILESEKRSIETSSLVPRGSLCTCLVRTKSSGLCTWEIGDKLFENGRECYNHTMNKVSYDPHIEKVELWSSHREKCCLISQTSAMMLLRIMYYLTHQIECIQTKLRHK